jgi:1-acyl-sn-glycerol-3-phosphate acyltransferase
MELTQTTIPSFTPLQALSQAVLRLAGWRIIGSFPALPKYIIIGAPHTTNWDFFYMLLIKGRTGVNIHWLGKDSLFRRPFGGLMKWLGGIPVNRQLRKNLVDQIVDQFQSRQELKIAVTPEGTRSRSGHWKTGFYYMALGANVPIQLVSISYPTRILEIGPLLIPTGTIEMDFEVIRQFYKDKIGKYPEKQGEVRLSSEDFEKP